MLSRMAENPMKSPLKSWLLPLVIVCAPLWMAAAHAGVTIYGTRVVYPSASSDITVKLMNKASEPALVQVWLDDGSRSATPDTSEVPFTITPPVARIEPNAGQALRVSYTGEPLASTGKVLPTDRESLFFFNMLEVPPKIKEAAGKNYLRFAFRTRIKFFYRPKGLTGTPEQAAQDLRWSVVRGTDGVVLQATNASPFYVSLTDPTLHLDGKEFLSTSDAKDSGMVAPFGTIAFKVKGLTVIPPAGTVVDAMMINDMGGGVPLEAKLAR
jgi:chaperone protein EcpD